MNGYFVSSNKLLAVFSVLLSVSTNSLAVAEQPSTLPAEMPDTVLETAPKNQYSEGAIVKPVYALFDAMRAHDDQQILQQFTQTALLHRVDKQGQVKNTDINQFADFVSKSTNYLDEKLLTVTVLKHGNLASVWTPFVFYADGKLSHCGINSFQLVLLGNEWKIHYLIDNTHQGDCHEFIKAQSLK